MSYTHFRYIAYQVPTVGNNGAARSNVGPGTATLDPRWGGNLPAAIAGITNADARNRVAMLYAVLLDAQAQVATLVDDVYTLKVFVAPEFYFRPDAAGWTTGVPAYSVDEYRQIKTALRTLLNDNLFINWVVIPGTIMWTGKGTLGRRPNIAKNVYFNSSLYIKVGKYKAAHGKVIEKTNASNLDGLPTGANDLASNVAYNGRYSTQAKRRKHVFTHYGTACGVEICLEHGLEMLKQTLSDQENWREWMVRKRISLQIITAGGMPINTNNITVCNNGYIMRTDGLCQPTAPGYVYSELRSVTGYIQNGVNVQYGVQVRNAQCNNANPVGTINLAGQLLRPTPGAPGNWFPQVVRIFGRQPLP